MALDRFTEISAERFRALETGFRGNSVMLFAYDNRSVEPPVYCVGLWLSRLLIKSQIEVAHYIPDSECRDALAQSRGAIGGFIWLGLPVEKGSESAPQVIVPQFMLDDYERLALDTQVPLQSELESRFAVQISTDVEL